MSLPEFFSVLFFQEHDNKEEVHLQQTHRVLAVKRKISQNCGESPNGGCGLSPR